MRSIDNIVWDVFGGNVPDNPLGRISYDATFSFPFFADKILNLKLSQFHKDAMEKIYQRYLLVIWPRQHLKTTMFSQAYNIWRLWREKEKILGIVSSSTDQSKKVIEDVQIRIEDNEFLQPLIPNKREDTWNKFQMNTVNGNRFFMKPFNSTSRGMAFDFLTMDDILREENISQTQIKEYFWGIFYPTVQTRRGQIIMVGTPMTARDLFADLEEGSPNNDWVIIHKPAVEYDQNGVWIKPLWPERFTLSELEKIKNSMGTLIFSREYLCKPKSGGANIFRMKKIGSHLEISHAREGYVYYIGVDVSMSGSKSADFLVFSIVAKDRDGNLKQIKQERYQGRDENFILKRILELNEAFHPRKIGIEQIGISVGIVNMLMDNTKFPQVSSQILPFKMNRWQQKEELISVLQSACETGQLTVLDNPILLDEMDAFQLKEDDEGKVTFEGVGQHDDCVIALALAVSAAQDKTGRISIEFIGPPTQEELEKLLKEEEEELAGAELI